MTEQTFAVAANILSTMPSQQPWDDRVSMVYAIAMQRWNDDLVSRAVTYALMTKKFRPTPAELREVALQLKRVRIATPQAAQQLKHIIVYHPLERRNKAMEEMVKQGKVSPILPMVVKNCGGWGRVGTMTEDQLSKAVERAMEDAAEDPALDNVLTEPYLQLEGSQLKMIGD